MKKSTIWILGIVMGLSFLSLLFLQVSYMEETVKMRREQFDESVQRGLDQACRSMELMETRNYLEADAMATEKAARMAREAERSDTAHVSDEEAFKYTQRYSVSSSGGVSRFKWEMEIGPNMSKPIMSTGKNIPQTARTLREILNDRYVHQRALLDEVVFNILRTASDKPLKQRVNFKQLDAFLKVELRNNGITIPYHFTVTDRMGTMIYHCSDYIPDGNETLYSHVLFKNDPPQRMGMVNVHFPTMDSYIFSSVRFMIPSIIFTCVLLVTFIFTICIIFRQKKLTEIKNDFINNMTHEFKTPISTISLAAQMLQDPAVGKSPAMFQHISGEIFGDLVQIKQPIGMGENTQTLRLADFFIRPQTFRIRTAVNRGGDGVVSLFQFLFNFIDFTVVIVHIVINFRRLNAFVKSAFGQFAIGFQVIFFDGQQAVDGEQTPCVDNMYGGVGQVHFFAW